MDLFRSKMSPGKMRSCLTESQVRVLNFRMMRLLVCLTLVLQTIQALNVSMTSITTTNVSVTSITTTNVTLRWSHGSDVINYYYLKIGESSLEFPTDAYLRAVADQIISKTSTEGSFPLNNNQILTGTTRLRVFTISGLESDAWYSILVTSGDKKWFNTLRTAACPSTLSGFERRCYRLHRNKISWEEASQNCSLLSTSFLAHPRSMDQLRFIQNLLFRPDLKKSFFSWVGVHDKDRNHKFSYSDGSTVANKTSTFWADCEKEQRVGAETNCIALSNFNISQNLLCSINNCETSYYDFVCEFPVPFPPRIISIEVGTNFADVFWDIPRLLPESKSTFYNISMTSSTGDYRSILAQTNQSNSTIRNLIPGSDYCVLITTIVDVGEGFIKSGAYPKNDFVTKPLPPQNLSVSDVTPTSAVITWSLPDDKETSSIYHGFFIYYHPLNIASNSTVSTQEARTQVNASTTEVRLSHLEPLTVFEVVVTSFVSYDILLSGPQLKESVASEPNNFETLVSPPLSFEVVNITTEDIFLRWEKALGSIDRYEVTINRVNDSSSELREYLSDVTVASENKLVPGAAYDIKIVSVRRLNISSPLRLLQRTRPLRVESHQVNTIPASKSVTININRWPGASSVFDGYNISLISQNPPETILWRIDKNDLALHDSSVVTGLTPGRTYNITIWVTSGPVLSAPSEMLQRITLLERPTDFRLKSRDERQLRLQWDPAPGDFIYYVVTCSGGRGYNCSTSYMQVSREKTELQINNLIPGALYEFRLVAQQDLSSSKPAILYVRTLPDPPTDAQIRNRNTTYVGVNWKSAEFFQDKYRIEFKPIKRGFYHNDPPAEGRVVIPFQLGDQNVQISEGVPNLDPGTLYEFYIQTGSGEAWSKSTVISASTIPEAVRSFRVDEIGATWVLLAWQQGKGAADKFKLSLAEVEVYVTASEVNPRKNFTFLEPATMYRPLVVALSGDDESDPVGISIRSRPHPPTEVEAMEVAETFFSLTWHSSKWDNVTILYSSSGRQNKSHTKNNDITIQDVVPGSKYEVTIMSVASSVESFPVKLVVFTHPFPPKNVSVENVSTTVIQLKWEEPEGENGGFSVEWFPEYGEINMLRNGAVLSDLTPGIAYSIKVYSYSTEQKLLSRSSVSVRASTKEAVPGIPGKLVITSVTQTSFFASWSPPEHPNGRITQYELRYQEIFPNVSSSFKPVDVDGEENSFRVEGVKLGAAYYVIVRAKNSAGKGNFTEPQLTWLQEGKPGPVRDLEAIAVSSSRLSVTWNPPTSLNGVIISYFLQVAVMDGGMVARVELVNRVNFNKLGCLFDDVSDDEVLSLSHSSIWKEVISTLERKTSNLIDFNSTENQTIIRSSSNENWDHERIEKVEVEPFCPVRHELGELTPYTTYIVTVAAKTFLGSGPAESFTVVTRQRPPDGPPINVQIVSTHSQNVTAMWGPPLRPNGFITYSVKLYQDSMEPKLMTTNETSLLIENLQPFSTYGVAILASSKAGSGPWSRKIYFNTSEGIPEEVLNLEADVIGSRSVMLKWTAPLQPHGVITSYVIKTFDVLRKILTTKYQNVTETQQVAETTLILHDPNSNSSSSMSSSTSIHQLGSLIRNPVTSNYSVMIDSLTPFTRYDCQVAAITSAGTGKFESVNALTLQDVPGSPPRRITYSNITSTSVNITWLEPTEPNGVITEYVVGISNGGITKHRATTRYVVIDQLEKFHRYEVYVWAWTKKGEGPSSNKVILHTDEDVPDSQPLNVEYKNISSRAIEVWWKPPLIPNGILTHYTIYYNTSNKTLNKTSNTTSAILDRLQPYGLYEIRVAASTKVGEGPHLSDPLWARVLEGQPGTPPFNLSYKNVTSHEIVLSWLPPTSPNGIIQHYEVTLIDKNNSISLSTNDETPSLVITSLRPYTEYDAVVRSNTKHGDGGQESPSLRIWTMQDAPGSPPRQLRYVNMTSSSINVTWLPPIQPNGEVVNYTVRWKMTDTRDIWETKHAKTGQAVIDGLKKYTQYLVRVSARTVAGEGPSAELLVWTDEDEPSSSPYDVIYKQLSSTSIVLSWKPPLHPNGVIQSYRVFYGNSTHSLHKDSPEPNVTLEGLRKFGKYEASVAASTIHGDGKQRSEKIAFETLEDAPSDPPSNLRLLPVSSISLNVSWSPPLYPNGRIQFYTLFYQQEGSSTQEQQVFGSTSAVITGLKKYTWYVVWVTASTAKGDGGHRSNKNRARTLEDVPDFSVKNLTVFNITASAMTVSWDPSLPLTGPTYFYIEITLATLNTLERRLTTNSTNIFVSQLKPFTAYLVSVAPRVFGIKEEGPKNEVLVTTGEDKPGSPVQDFHYFNTTSDSVGLKWKSPLQANGVITNYSIDVSPDGIMQDVAGNITTTYIHNLRPHTAYTAVIYSRTKIGPGPSASVQFQTLEDVPSDAPSNIQIFNITESSVVGTWNPPKTPNGLITGYVLTYQTQSLSGRNSTETVVAGSTEMKVQALSPFTTYFLTVSAFTAVGLGPQSDPPQQFTTLEGTPEVPSSFSCFSSDENTVETKWGGPSKSNGVITGYTIAYRPVQGEITYLNLTADVHKHVINGLMPYTDHDIAVSAWTKAGEGPAASCIVRTKQGYPGPPQNLSVPKVAENGFFLSWLPPNQINGELKEYIVVYTPPDGCATNQSDAPESTRHEELHCEIKVGLNRTYYLDNLKEFTLYNMTVKAVSGKGPGPATDVILRRTDEGAPTHPPRFVSVRNIYSTSISVTWEQPEILAGLTRYQVTAANSQQTATSSLLSSQTRKYVIENLDENTLYDITVTATTSKGNLSSIPVQVKTLEAVPSDAPRNLTIIFINGNSTTVSLLFQPPLQPNGKLVSYDLQYQVIERNETINVTMPVDLLHHVGSNHSWLVHGLLGGRRYMFRIRAATKVGVGPWSAWSPRVRTLVTAPPQPFITPQLPNDVEEESLVASTSLTISSPCVFSNVNGRIAMIGVIIAEDGANLEEEPRSWKTAYKISPSPTYLVVASKNPQEDCPGATLHGSEDNARRKRSLQTFNQGFVIGDDASCASAPDDSYCNGPLKPDALYRFKFRAETETGLITDTEYSDPIRTKASVVAKSTVVIIGVAAGAVGVACVLALGFVFARRRRATKFHKSTCPDEFSPALRSESDVQSMPLSKGPIVESGSHLNKGFACESPQCDKVSESPASRPILKTELGSCISRLSRNQQQGFNAEFTDLSARFIAGETSVAEAFYNKMKNRRSGSVPDDLHRVRLHERPGVDGSDYINASFIPGEAFPHQYISTQLPLRSTQSDFWRMMWEVGAPAIVMLCDVKETASSRDTYWPRKEEARFDQLRVRLVSVQKHPGWIVRQFRLEKTGQFQEVTQFNLLKWPTARTSVGAKSLLRFIQKTRACLDRSSSPLVVMSGDGSERSGVYICMDRILDQIRSQTHVDLYGLVATIRRYRASMVPTLSEYIFLHHCVYEVTAPGLIAGSAPTGDGLEETVF